MSAMQDTATMADWKPFDEVYRSFAEANPMLGLGTGEWAATNLRRNYGERLVQLGAALQLPNRRWLAHAQKFGPALFEALTAARAEIEQRVQARAS